MFPLLALKFQDRFNLNSSTMKKIASLIFIAAVMQFIFNLNSNAQCNTSASISGPTCLGAGNLGATLSGNPVTADWKLNNVTVKKDYATWTTPATLVAGGNGSGNGSNQFNYPRGICIDAADNVYVVDMFNYRVQKFAPGATDGVTVAGGNGQGTNANQLYQPTDVKVDAAGNVYVADQGRVQVWAPGATSGTTLVSSSNGDYFNTCWIFLDAQNNLYLSDYSNSRVLKYAPGALNGVTVAGGNGAGNAANQLYGPQGIFVDPSGNIYVCDNNNARIQKWEPGATSGTTFLGDGSFYDSPTAVSNPAYITMDGAGNSYVVTGNSQIRFFPAGSNSCIELANGQTGGGFAEGIALSSNHDIYVAFGFNVHSLKKFSYNGFSTSSFTPAAEGSYSLLVTGFDGCSSSSASLNVYKTPVISDGNMFSLCKGNSITLHAANTSGFVWNPGNVSGATATFSPAITSTFTLSDLHNCTATAQVFVTDVGPVSVSGTACTGNPLTASIPSVPASLQWKLNGTTEHTETPNWNPAAVTVAGGNGSGSAANQFSNLYFGLVVDPAGNLYVADAGNSRIQKWAPGATQGETVAGSVVNGYAYGAGPNQLNGPEGIFVDRSGNLYIADAANNRVQKWAPGAASGVTVAGGNGFGSDLNQLKYPSAVYVDPSGNVYVLDGWDNARVMKWAPGATQGEVVAGGNGKGNADNQINLGTGMVVDNDGNIYVLDWYANRVQKWTPGATTGITIISGFANANGLWRDGAGYFYVVNSPYVYPNYESHIARFKEGDFMFQEIIPASSGSGANQLSGATIGCFDAEGSMYVVDGGNRRVQKFSPSSIELSFVPSYGSYSAVATSFGGCTAASDPINVLQAPELLQSNKTICPGSTATLTVTNAGSFTWNPGNLNGSSIIVSPSVSTTYTISDNGNNCQSTAKVSVRTSLNPVLSGPNCSGGGNLSLSTSGTPAKIEWKLNGNTVHTDYSTYNGTATTVGTAAYPKGVTVDKDGNVYAANSSQGIIYKWMPGNPTPVIVAGGNGLGTAANQIGSYPGGLFVDDDGNLYISDASNHRVQKWAPGATSGVTVAGGNGIGIGLNQFSSMGGLFVDKSGNIYVSDAAFATSRVVKWAPGATTGELVAGGNGYGGALNQLWNPNGIYVDDAGNVYVAEEVNARVTKWAPGATTAVIVAGGNGNGYGNNQLYYPEDVTLDSQGNLYVLNAYSGYIMKWEPGASTGTYLVGYCCSGNGMSSPMAMDFDEDGNLYVADYGNSRIQKYSTTITSSYLASGAGNYSVVATSFAGCSSASNTTLVNDFPTVTLTGNQYFCSGNSTTLDAGIHQQYAWSTGSTAQTESFSTEGSYSVSVTDNNCTTSRDFYVDALTAVMNVSASPSTICSGNTTQLNATLISGGKAHLTKTYFIDASHLIGMGNSCGDVRYGQNFSTLGFSLADSGVGTATSITLQFNVGYHNYYNMSYYMLVNDYYANGNFSVPNFGNSCATSGNAIAANNMNVNVDPAHYTVGGSNTFSISVPYGYSFGLLPTAVTNNYFAKVIVNYEQSVVSYSWAPDGGTITNPVVTPAATTTYTLTANSLSCTSTSTVTVTVGPAPGDTSVYGDHVWNVYAFNAGGATDNGHSWNEGYSGYYVDNTLNFNTTSRWNSTSSPSGASGYNGCIVNNDNHSWSAKRRGFPCGNYSISINGHDDEAQLFVNGVKVWEHIGCCDSHNNVWTGFLDDNSTMVFRGTDGSGGSNGAITIAPTNAISANGPLTFCPGYTVQLTAPAADSYVWSTGATSQSITVSSTGTYSVTATTNGCNLTDSKTITVAAIDTPAIHSYTGLNYCPGPNGVDLNIDYNPRYASIQWSTGDTWYYTTAYAAGPYSVTVSDVLGCSATSHVTTVSNAAGVDSTFGDHVWKVNAYAQGFYTGYYYYYTSGRAWHPDDYSGYYLDSTLNFNSQNKWNTLGSPSDAAGYLGCTVADDNISWSAKRRGFDCGVYQIDVTSHDDDADLYIDGVQVWSHYNGCCDLHTNVWTGALNASSTVEFRVNEMGGGDNGSLQFTLLNSNPNFLTATGHPVVCSGQSYTLTSSLLGTYSWSNGGSTNPLDVYSSGSYYVTVTDANGCSLTSNTVNVTILSDPAPVAAIDASSNAICNWTPVTLTSQSSTGNSWSTNAGTQSITVSDEGNYLLTVTNNAGCFDTASILLKKGFIPPAPSAGNSGPVCQNASVNLTVSGLAPAGKAASFNGASQYFKVNQDIPEYDFTIEMWVKTTAANAGIFSATEDGGGFDRNLYLANGKLWTRVYNSGGWNTGFTVNDGKWHHIALVVQTGVGQTVYVDGTSSGVGNSFDHSNFNWQSSFLVGYCADAYYYARYFNGQIDNVRIWSEARSQSDIRSNMMLESPLSITNLVYACALNGTTNATVGNNAAVSNVTFADPQYFTYIWEGNGAPAASMSETQTIASIGSGGTYSVTASSGGCDASAAASTNVTVLPLVTYYADADGDGYGNAAASIISCSAVSGYVTDYTDCNDADSGVKPGTSEICNNIDDNCDGQIDEGVKTTFYRDADGDGYGNAANSVVACTAPSGYVSNNTDCNDNKASVNPGALELCGNGVDDNCNGIVDENCCQNASSLSTSNITNNSAQLNWVAATNPTAWQVQYKKVKQGSQWVTVIPNPAPSARSVTITGLTSKQNYQWHIRAKCGSTWTAYSAPVTFATLARVEDALNESSPTLNVYPNPSTGLFTVDLYLEGVESADADIMVINSMGQLVQRETTAINDGRLSQEIRIAPGSPAGMYMIRVTIGDHVFTKQLIIQR